MAAKTRLKVGNRTLEVSNYDKVLYPGGRFTKGQVIDYYRRIAPVMLPHLRNRPVTMKRFPDGVHGDFFYEKDLPQFAPAWIETFPVPRRDTSFAPIQYLVVNDAPALAWAASIACLEFHPFLHRAPKIDTPTLIAFDLDPGEGADILTCVVVAFLVRETLGKLRLKCFPKVSGSKGIQLYVPLNTPVTYDATRGFACAIAEVLASRHPELIVADMAKHLRHNKVFIDWSQNTDHKTTVSVYSLRAKREHPYVSLPVKWQEMKAALRSKDPKKLFWTADKALARVEKMGDLFAPVLTLKQQLPPEFAGRHPAQNAQAPGSLEDYASKRNFSRTREPAPAAPSRASKQGSRRRFVIQKHAASHLHYDFRLEMGGTLKSWAVPKDIPVEPGKIVSAFPTEDHPLEYLEFEGTIPQGQYGGGTVMVWDIGTYEVIEGNYWKGKLSVFLNGKKLGGEWTFERDSGSTDKPRWRLAKTGGPAKRLSLKSRDRSALTGRTLEQIAKENSAVWQSDRPVKTKVREKPEASPPRKKKPVRTEAPQFVAPMKPTLVSQLPGSQGWSYEVKWDGYRALALKHGEKVRLLSLKEKSLASAFPAIVEAVKTIQADTATLDGEIVAVNAKGRPSFQALQNPMSLGREWHVVYYAFDLLNHDGKDLRALPLEQRKHALQRLLAGSAVRFSAALPGTADKVLAAVKRAGLEGIVAKRKDSPYVSGRSPDWQKLKLDLAQEFVIGGYKPEAGSFSSILVGYFERDRLLFAGKVRQGLNPGLRSALLKKMRPLRTSECPFENLPSSKTGHFGEGITAEDMPNLCWVRPKLVAEVGFTEWTAYGLLRHATFRGLREDKEPSEVVRE